MIPALLGLILLAGSAVGRRSAENFPLKLKSLKNEWFVFSVEFSEKNFLLSEKEFHCDTENDCKILSSVREYDYFNQTSYSFLPIEVAFYTSENQKIVFWARYTDLGKSYFGMGIFATWGLYIKDACLKIDFVTGDAQLLVNCPKDLLMLQFNPDRKEFYMDAKLHQEADLMLRYNTVKSDAKVKLYFPQAANPYNGQYFFLVTSNHVEGWENFATTMSAKNMIDQFKLWIDFNNNQRLNMGIEFFRSYDNEPIKRLDDYYSKTEMHIGRFFVLKSKMKFFIRISESKISPAYVEMVDGKLDYFYWFTFVGLLNFLSWAVFYFSIACVIIHLVPIRHKRWIPNHFAEGVPIR